MKMKKDVALRSLFKNPPAYKCVTWSEYKEWEVYAKLNPPPVYGWFCVDCTQKYQKQMIKENKCINKNFDNFNGGGT